MENESVGKQAGVDLEVAGEEHVEHRCQRSASRANRQEISTKKICYTISFNFSPENHQQNNVKIKIDPKWWRTYIDVDIVQNAWSVSTL